MKVASIIALLLASISLGFGERPKVGDTAPFFTGTDQDGKDFNLSDLLGKKVILLYFYPKDFTSGCTKEACGFRDRMGEFQTNNVAVVGVSCDSAEKHKQFIAKYNLNFPLIADPDGKIVELYDVKLPVLKMSKRVSFLIGLDGKIVHVTDSNDPQVHFNEMQAAIAALNRK